MVPIEELHGCSPGWIFRQFIKLEKRMPSEHFAEEISRRGAYSINAFLLVAQEFFPAAGGSEAPVRTKSAVDPLALFPPAASSLKYATGHFLPTPPATP